MSGTEQDRSRGSRSPSKFKALPAEGLSRGTHFSSEEIRSLSSLYREITGGWKGGKMDRLHFRELMHTSFDITDDVMLDRIFRAFDSNNDSLIDEQEWIHGFSVFLRGTLDEHINFAYFCYDINGDRSLAREELYHCLKNCLIRTTGIDEDVEESVKEIVEIAMRKLDMDKNGQITFSDFQAAVLGDPLLLEACGPCLPTTKAVAAFFIDLKKYGGGVHPSGSTRQSRNELQNVSKKRAMRRSSSCNAVTF